MPEEKTKLLAALKHLEDGTALLHVTRAEHVQFQLAAQLLRDHINVACLTEAVPGQPGPGQPGPGQPDTVPGTRPRT